MKIFATIQNAFPRINNSPFREPMSWTAYEGEVWSVAGKNGSGKTLFSEVICGKYNLLQGEIHYPFFDKIKQGSKSGEFPYLRQYIKTVSFNSVYSIADFREMYYQQRFNSTESDHSPFVDDFFSPEEVEKIDRFSKMLHFDKLRDRRLIQLSSGELRKLLIAKVLVSHPKMIIFDNPFIGLDEFSRKQLDDFFHQLKQENIQLLFLTPSTDDLPSATTHLLQMEKGTIISAQKIEDFRKQENEKNPADEKFFFDWGILNDKTATDFETAVKMTDVSIVYGKRVIASNINWEIRKGEKWALLGPNGSGNLRF